MCETIILALVLNVEVEKMRKKLGILYPPQRKKNKNNWTFKTVKLNCATCQGKYSKLPKHLDCFPFVPLGKSSNTW